MLYHNCDTVWHIILSHKYTTRVNAAATLFIVLLSLSLVNWHSPLLGVVWSISQHSVRSFDWAAGTSFVLLPLVRSELDCLSLVGFCSHWLVQELALSCTVWVQLAFAAIARSELHCLSSVGFAAIDKSECSLALTPGLVSPLWWLVMWCVRDHCRGHHYPPPIAYKPLNKTNIEQKNKKTKLLKKSRTRLNHKVSKVRMNFTLTLKQKKVFCVVLPVFGGVTLKVVLIILYALIVIKPDFLITSITSM